MRAFGSDRVRKGSGEQWTLACRRPKGWLPRTPKTLTTSEHPGTAVLWDERLFEVVIVENDAAGVRYVLEPWRDNHVIRVSDAYDEASELRRETEYRAAVAREKGRKAANLAGIFVGHLPAVVQEQLGREIGIRPTRLASLSLLLPLAYLIWFANDFARRTMDPSAGPMPLSLIAIAIYVFIESAIRLNIIWLQNRPVGSAAGGILYLLFYLVAGRRTHAVSPFAVERGYKVHITTPSDETALRDAFTMREPLLTLLSPPEQALLAERFGYNYRTSAFKVAIVLLVVALAGVITSVATLRHGLSLSALLSLIAAGLVAIDQMIRLPALRHGPAGSALAVLVRPFVMKLLR